MLCLVITIMIIRKISIFHEKGMYFEKIQFENRPEASCFTRCHNASSYDITGQEAWNWCKKYYVTVFYWKIYEMALWKGKSGDKTTNKPTNNSKVHPRKVCLGLLQSEKVSQIPYKFENSWLFIFRKITCNFTDNIKINVCDIDLIA